ncbi:MAG: ABC transporter substrate-binding protein [Atopobiaceae bacterium]|jgi:peptide/nickel transport system substrate-binding protein
MQINTAHSLSRRSFLAGAGMISALGALAGCSSNSSSDSEGSAATEETSYRDTLQIALPASPDGLDPAMTSSTVTVDIMANVLEPLYGMDNTYEPQPILAESATASDDGLTYTIKLRSGVKFHDGSDLTAKDAAASMNHWHTVCGRAQQLLPDATFEATGDLELVAKLSQPASDFLTIIGAHSQYAGIVPQAVADAAGEGGITTYTGTGAYKFDEWKQDQYIHLVRNDDYQPASGEPSGFAGKISAPTKELYFRFVTDSSTRVTGFETDEYDIVDEIPTENYHDFDGNSDVKLYERASGVLTAFFNQNAGVFADEDIRKCAQMAINCDDAALAAYGEAELFTVDCNLMSPDNAQWANDSGKALFNQNNPDGAKEALTKTSYNGEKVRLLTTPDYKEMYNSTVALQEQLQKAGFNAEIVSFEFATFMEYRSSKPEEWDLFVASTNYKPIPAQSLSVSKDFYGLSDEEALDLVAQTRTAADHAAALEAWKQAQQRLYDIAVVLPLCHYKSLTGTQADVEDFEQFDGSVVWNAYRPE